METLGYRLAEARKNCGLTQAQVAEKLFLTTQSISSWECGNTVPDTEKVPEIAALYGVTTDWLLSGKLPSDKILKVTSHLSDRLFSETRMATYVGAYCNAKHLYQTRRALALGLEDDDLLSACLLHDVCEDCGVKPEELPVSDAAKEAVRLLTKPENFEKTDKDETAYYNGIAGNRIATMVKLLDRCNNIASMATSFS